jgi:hypothetical protein
MMTGVIMKAGVLEWLDCGFLIFDCGFFKSKNPDSSLQLATCDTEQPTQNPVLQESVRTFY